MFKSQAKSKTNLIRQTIVLQIIANSPILILQLGENVLPPIIYLYMVTFNLKLLVRNGLVQGHTPSYRRRTIIKLDAAREEAYKAKQKERNTKRKKINEMSEKVK